MKLEKFQREQLQNILTSPDFKAVEFFLRELRRDIGVAEVLIMTEWDFIKNSLQKEYQMALLEQLVRLMEDVAAEGDKNVGNE